MSKNNNFAKFKESTPGTAVILGVITLVVGFVLAAFNSLTAPEIEKRLRDEKEDSIIGFFGEGIEYEYIDFDFAEPAVDAVAVYVKNASSKKLAGYCVTVAPRGFAEDIVMLVAINTNITVRGVKILEMSETAGIGTKIESESWFIDQFKFKSKNITVASPSGGAANAIDTVSGATKSSKAFLAGVNAALESAYEIRNQSAEAPKTTEENKEIEETEETETEEIFDE